MAASEGLERVLILVPSRTYLSASDMRDLLIKLAILIAWEIEKSLFLLTKSRPDGGTHHEAAWDESRPTHATFCIFAAKNKYSHAPQTACNGPGADLGFFERADEGETWHPYSPKTASAIQSKEKTQYGLIMIRIARRTKGGQ